MNARSTWIKFTALIGIMGFEAWFINEPTWEPALGFLTSFFTYIIAEVTDCKKYTSHDIDLYKQFLHEVPSDGFIEFFRTQDFAGSFLAKYLDSFYDFLRKWNKLEVKFINKKLQKEFNKFVETCIEMQKLIGECTVVHRGGIQRVIPNKEKQLSKKLEEKYKSEIKKLNNCADQLYVTYTNFITKYQNKISQFDFNSEKTNNQIVS